MSNPLDRQRALVQRLMTPQEGPQGVGDILGQAAVATSPLPVVGDIVGGVADAHMYATQPESRTLANALMSGVGLLPWLPAAATVKKTDMAKKYREIIDQIADDYDHIGLRTVDEPITEFRSRIWVDGEPTEEMLDGLSVTDVNEPTAFQAHRLEEGDSGYYPGEYTYVIGGNMASYGEDLGELILKDPVILYDPTKAVKK